MKRRHDPEAAARVAAAKAEIEAEAKARVAAWLAWRACPVQTTPIMDWRTATTCISEADRIAIVRAIAPNIQSATLADLEAVIYAPAARATAERLGHYGPTGRTFERKLEEPLLHAGDKWHLTPEDRADWDARHPIAPRGPWVRDEGEEEKYAAWGV